MKRIINLISHDCQYCGQPHLSLFILLVKGARFCKKCGEVISFDNYFVGGMSLVFLMLGLAFMKSTMFELLGSTSAKVLFMILMILIFLVGPRIFFKVTSKK